MKFKAIFRCKMELHSSGEAALSLNSYFRLFLYAADKKNLITPQKAGGPADTDHGESVVFHSYRAGEFKFQIPRDGTLPRGFHTQSHLILCDKLSLWCD
jgi:hypothetical protein